MRLDIVDQRQLWTQWTVRPCPRMSRPSGPLRHQQCTPAGPPILDIVFTPDKLAAWFSISVPSVSIYPTNLRPCLPCNRSDIMSYARAQIWLEQRIRLFFYDIGTFIGDHPKLCIGVTLIGASLLSLGIFNFKEVNDVREQFSADSSLSRTEYAIAREFFQEQGSPFYLVIGIQAGDGGSLLRNRHIDRVMDVERFLQYELNVTYENVTYAFSDLCGTQCQMGDAVHYFLTMYKDTKKRKSPNVKLTYPTMDLFGEKIYLANNFYTVTIDENSRVIESCGLIALHFRATYSNDTIYRVLQLWERAVLEFVNKHRPGMSDITVYTTSEGLVSQEVRRTGMSPMPLMPITFIIIMAFTVVTSLKVKSSTSKPWEAVAGVLCPLIALVAAFGLLFMLNFEFIPLLNVIPFLVLAIGVDDVYVTLHAWHLTDRSLPVTRRMGETMADAGPSITITSLTNALSFGIGALSPTPAIRIFCIFAACTVTFGYIYQVFLFTPILALGGRREKNGTNAYFWWKTANDKEVEQTDQTTTAAASKGEELLSKFWDLMVDLAMSWWTRGLVVIVMLAYWTFSIRGVMQVRVGLSAEKLFLDDSPLHDFVRLQTEIIFKEAGQMFVFVNKPGDLRNPDQMAKIMRMLNQFEHATGSIGPESSHLWLQQYLPFVGFHSSAEADAFFNNEPVAFSYKYLPEFLKSRSYERWRYFLKLGETEQCLNDEPACVDRFFFTTGFKNASEWNYRLKLLLEWRTIADNHADLEASVYEDFSMYTDQILSIGPATKQTVAMALICMALVCVVFIPHAISIACATLSVLSINLGVFGGLTYWRVELDPISMATILMAIGFSVDYTAHISYHYYKGDAQNAKARLKHALASIGWPMLQAGLSTLISVLVLIAVHAYMVDVFVKTVFLVVFLGLVHGLVILPVVLAALPFHKAPTAKDAWLSAEPNASTSQQHDMTLKNKPKMKSNKIFPVAENVLRVTKSELV